MAEQIFERLAAEFREHTPHHHGTSQAPAPQPVNLTAAAPAAQTEEKTVSLSEDLKTFVTRLETLGEDVVTQAETVAKNPETAAVLSDLAQLASIAGAAGIPAGYITDIARPLAVLVNAYTQTGAAPPAA